jgi:hypothetical protein
MIRLLLILCLLLPSLATAQEKNPSFNLVNKSQQPIRQLFVTPAGDANWGQNRLTKGPIIAGGQFEVRRKIDGNCIFDIRVVYADGSKEERRMLNTCTTEDVLFPASVKTTGSGKAADDPTFRLTNHLTQPIAELYASPVGQPRGANLLEKGTLAPDATLTIHPPKGHGCSFKLELVTADKDTKSRTLDLCARSELSVP